MAAATTELKFVAKKGLNMDSLSRVTKGSLKRVNFSSVIWFKKIDTELWHATPIGHRVLI